MDEDTQNPQTVQTLVLEAGKSSQMTLPPGSYILSVTMPGSSPEEFHFGISVP